MITRVRCIRIGPPFPLEEQELYDAKEVDEQRYDVNGKFYPKFFFEDLGPSPAPAPAPASALEVVRRDNKTKPESDYILTYIGGIDLVFRQDFDFYSVVDAFAKWYRGEASAMDALFQLHESCEQYEHDVMSALVETNTFGANEYGVGNYLKPRTNLRQYAQSFVRHAKALNDGETHDVKGNNHLGALAFNCLMVVQCEHNPHVIDDRIRA